MKLLSLIALVFATVAHTALGIPQVSAPSLPDAVGDLEGAVPMEELSGAALEDANNLGKLCEDGGSNAYVAVKYKGGEEVVYSYNMCLLGTRNGNRDVMAVFCKSVTCYGHSNYDCTGDMSAGIMYVKGTVVAAETAGTAFKLFLNRQSATCQALEGPV
ncbi:unnamed protein product [Cyclocybe aegerita]|uniref:Uncharacterized protein n=1 Tax=Cyclocybe aegerita TaxID=1973307 RepID=A0A8S0WZX1_CYCAE|nr:unnamed protein product [Cyclocybe aegerita]